MPPGSRGAKNSGKETDSRVTGGEGIAAAAQHDAQALHLYLDTLSRPPCTTWCSDFACSPASDCSCECSDA